MKTSHTPSLPIRSCGSVAVLLGIFALMGVASIGPQIFTSGTSAAAASSKPDTKETTTVIASAPVMKTDFEKAIQASIDAATMEGVAIKTSNAQGWTLRIFSPNPVDGTNLATVTHMTEADGKITITDSVSTTTPEKLIHEIALPGGVVTLDFGSPIANSKTEFVDGYSHQTHFTVTDGKLAAISTPTSITYPWKSGFRYGTTEEAKAQFLAAIFHAAGYPIKS